jgi:hypothetical protein
MKFTPWKPIACSLLLLTGCSGPREDVRVTFCKNLTVELLAPQTRIEWRDTEQRLEGYESAAITVHLELPERSGRARNMQATCRYPYDTVEENVMTHSDPLSAYATVPEQMTLNGRPVPEVKLREAILVVQLATGKAVVNRLKHGMDDGVERLQSAIGNNGKQ